jgi:hypothetical protein
MIYLLADGKDVLISSIHPDDDSFENNHIRITDSFTANRKDEQRLPGETLANIIRNALTASGDNKVTIV